MAMLRSSAPLQKLLALLAGYSGGKTVNNFYSSPHLLKNLEEYFNALTSGGYSGDLLVGEAPGHAGCARTGIPFTSENVLNVSTHPFVASLRNRVQVGGDQSETTSNVVWNCLISSRSCRLPAFWNAFPMHPHLVNSRRNRTPTLAEVSFGVDALAKVVQILKPRRVFAIGRAAEGTLKKHFSTFSAPYIRHPSYGGRNAFLKGVTSHGII